ncbi:hypothetical protein IFR05_008897 [Cadophora sp. M221]|nr:hypothetical protein IFR05_008897 [Cadophora sp. M221]
MVNDAVLMKRGKSGSDLRRPIKLQKVSKRSQLEQRTKKSVSLGDEVPGGSFLLATLSVVRPSNSCSRPTSTHHNEYVSVYVSKTEPIELLRPDKIADWPVVRRRAKQHPHRLCSRFAALAEPDTFSSKSSSTRGWYYGLTQDLRNPEMWPFNHQTTTTNPFQLAQDAVANFASRWNRTRKQYRIAKAISDAMPTIKLTISQMKYLAAFNIFIAAAGVATQIVQIYQNSQINEELRGIRNELVAHTGLEAPEIFAK